MLESEGFAFDRYIDIFDGGPTVTAPTDQIRTIKESDEYSVADVANGGNHKMLVAAGRLNDFRACCAQVSKVPKKGLCIDPDAAAMLEVKVGDKIVAVSRNGSH